MIESPVRAKCRYPNIQFRIGLRFSRAYDSFGNDLSVSGSWKSPFGYAGQFGYQEDVDTGLKLLGHRYYDSDTGRFLTRDPIKDGRNWYGYCTNEPIAQSDPSGFLTQAAHFLYALVTKSGTFLKWGVTKNPGKRYTRKFLEEHSAEVNVIVKSTDRKQVLEWERVAEEAAPGPLNRTPWAERAKKTGNQFAIALGSAVQKQPRPELDAYEQDIDAQTLDVTPLTYAPGGIGEVATAAQLFGNWVREVGRDWRRAHYDRDVYYLAE